MVTPSPLSENELLESASRISGKTLQQLAHQQNLETPEDQLHHKGWVGQLLELSLGATAGSLPEPDFQHIGVELKTLPLSKNGTPKESTYVCAINLTQIESQWETSLVHLKLSRVLWLPVEADPDIPLAARRIGSAILWSPNEEQETTLRRDWEELMELIATGELEQITAHQGQYLQVRPKAANTKALRKGFNNEGDEILTLPRGFYLRPSLTKQIIRNL
ncbi:MAG: DNA mismatch repair protein MutH [Gammaproteobacteria bacterium]|jgi:DNA mismatch repair protein MutH